MTETEINEPADQATANSAEIPTDVASPTADDTQPVEESSNSKEDELLQSKEKLLRLAADFDNFRKRARRDVDESAKKGRDGLLKELLPVFDNLERAAAHAESSQSKNPEGDWKGLADGIQLVIRQFKDTLGRVGIERVEAVGQPFDPSVHEAIQHMETTEYPAGSVAAEVQAGYRDGDRLVRAALVVVAKAPAEGTSEGDA
ncbi:MAG: nucleotide exchange factor GrpE [Polyangiaceae bacterium]|nr:nucleotide exchange factor GrpE [Polyangiaceae bacterium]